MTQPISNEANIGGDCEHGYPAGRHCPVCEKPTVSNEAVETAKWIPSQNEATGMWELFAHGRCFYRAKREEECWIIADAHNNTLQSAITKACAEREDFHRSLGITLLDAKWLDPECHQGCQSLVYKHQAAALSSQLSVMKKALEKAPNPHTAGVSDFAIWTKEVKEPALSNLPAAATKDSKDVTEAAAQKLSVWLDELCAKLKCPQDAEALLSAAEELLKDRERLKEKLRQLELEPCKQCADIKRELLKLRHKKVEVASEPESSIMKVLRKWYPDDFRSAIDAARKKDDEG